MHLRSFLAGLRCLLSVADSTSNLLSVSPIRSYCSCEISLAARLRLATSSRDSVQPSRERGAVESAAEEVRDASEEKHPEDAPKEHHRPIPRAHATLL